jgi:hypothetical protein
LNIVTSVYKIISYKIYKYKLFTLKFWNLKTYDIFRLLLGHYQVYCLCLEAELVFNMDPYFKYDYITCNIMFGDKILGIIYFLSLFILELDVII